MERDRVKSLAMHVEGNPIAILRIDLEELHALRASRRGLDEFTMAVVRPELVGLRPPTLCIVAAEDSLDEQLMMGVIGRPSAITTIHSRVKLKRVFPMVPRSLDGLVSLLDVPLHTRSLEKRVGRLTRLTMLTPKLSALLVERLATLDDNHRGLLAVASTLAAPRKVRSNAALQDMGLRTALRAFGLSSDDPADHTEILSEDETAVARLPLREDAAIEHDARWVRGLGLADSDLTGRAVFTRGEERLEVYTANRRHLEQAIGVDLVYFNAVMGNVVMVQYKMLDPRGAAGWTYWPDDQLIREIARMQAFCRAGTGAPGEYRLNPGVFYIKFVKRDASLRQGGIVMPLDHYEAFAASSDARGPRGGLRIDYEALRGRYLREQPFVDLIRGGYIGAYAEDSARFQEIVHAIVERGGAVVAAIQTAARKRRLGHDEHWE